MRITFVVLALLLTGCAHSPVIEPLHTAEAIPCSKDNCGKEVVWDNYWGLPYLAEAVKH